MPTTILDQSSNQEPRFNARSHGFSGETVVVRPEDRPRYREIDLKLHVSFTPQSEIENTFVKEMVAHKFQMQNVQHVINVMLLQKGDEAMLTGDYRLLRRYLSEHRRDFYRAFSAIQSIRRDKQRDLRLNGKVKVQIVTVSQKQNPETEFEKAKPITTNEETGAAPATAVNDSSQ